MADSSSPGVGMARAPSPPDGELVSDCGSAALQRPATEPVAPGAGYPIQRVDCTGSHGDLRRPARRAEPGRYDDPDLDRDDPPPEETGASPTDLIIPMQKFDPGDFGYDNLTLAAGEYEIELTGGTAISYAASGAGGPGPELWDPSVNHVISEFTVSGGGPTIGTATPLGAIGSTVQSIGGSLDPDNPDSAVDLYQFTLPEGHFWQVGLAISANSIGSPLQAGLSLMDSSGTVLATRDAGTGLASDPI